MVGTNQSQANKESGKGMNVDDPFSRLMRLRAGGAVKRYHTFPTLGNQTVGEHSHAVALLLFTLTAPSESLVFAALHHDLAEYDTGDCPANVKWKFPEMCKILEEAEASINETLNISINLTEDEKKWLQLCDTLEYCLYALEQRRLGNMNMDIVFHRGMKRLSSYELSKTPHISDFISNLQNSYVNAQMGNTPEDVSIS